MIDVFPNTEAQVIDKASISGGKRVLLTLKNGNMFSGKFEGAVYNSVALETGSKVKIPVKYKFRITDASHPDYKKCVEVDAGLIDIDETVFID